MDISENPISSAPISADDTPVLAAALDAGPQNPYAVLPPKPNYLICDRTGFKIPVQEGLKKEWTGLLVRKESWDPRHPQELVRTRPERSRGSPRPEPDEAFVEVYGLQRAPLVPTLNGANSGASFILTWNRPTYYFPNRIESYDLYRSLDGTTYTLLTTIDAANPLTYSDTADADASYYVIAVGTYLDSAPSNIISQSFIFATWDAATNNGNLTLSNGNLTSLRAASGAGAWSSIRSTVGVTTGKWYWETTVNVIRTNPLDWSITGVAQSSLLATQYVGQTATSYGKQPNIVIGGAGQRLNNGAGIPYEGGTIVGTVIRTALDMDNGYLWWGINSDWNGVGGAGDPATGAFPAYAGLSGEYFAALAQYTDGAEFVKQTVNFGQNAFSYAVPTGFNAGLFIG